MKESTFDIFRGTSDEDAVWLEAVEGLSAASERMEEIAAIIPGPYFIFSAASHSILARTEIVRARNGCNEITTARHDQADAQSRR
jgi:hypothetical protein